MKTVPLLDVAENITCTPEKFHGVRTYYAIMDVDGTNFLDGTSISYAERPPQANLIVECNDVLVAKMQGASKVIHVNGEAENAIFSTGFLNLRPNPHFLDSRFLFWFLRSPHFRDQKNHRCTEVAQKTLTLSDLRKINIPLPDKISEQKRIATILDKADSMEHKREKILGLSDYFLRSVYVRTIGHLNPNHENWKSLSIEQLAQDRKGAIRSGPFDNVLCSGKFVDKGIAVLDIDNVVQNKFVWPERRFIAPEKYEKLQQYKVYPHDVIVTIMGTTGRSSLVPRDIPEAITTKRLATITCNRGLIHPEVLSFAIHSDPLIIRQIESYNKRAIMNILNLDIIRKIMINLPPMREQLRFVSILRAIRTMEGKITDSKGSDSDLLQSLSQRAFRGEL